MAQNGGRYWQEERDINRKRENGREYLRAISKREGKAEEGVGWKRWHGNGRKKRRP